MTTQNTHNEQSDVDANVVEHPPVPENTVDSSYSETVTPAGADAQATDSPSNGPVTPAEVQVEATQEAPETPASTQTEEQHDDQKQTEATPEVSIIVTSTTPVDESGVLASAEAAADAASEEVRSFTDFIEEFRQSEEARISGSLQDIPAEPFQLLTPEAPTSAVEQPTDAATNTTEQEAAVTEQPTEQTTTPERAVSPLLRPATRLRLPRHGSNRHNREEAKEKASAAPEPVQQPEQSAPAEAEQPRPARRYRFDRPASNNGSTGTTGSTPTVSTPRTEEKRDAQQRGNEEAAETTKSAANTAPAAKQTTEQPDQKQAADQETPVAESATPENGRRRQGSERHKEQPTAKETPAVASPTEATTPTGDVAPEDLPPLEYSELQKASTRRRRRHRTGSNGTTSSPEQTPTGQPTPTTASPSAAPTTPATPTPIRPAATTETNGNQYSIVSGYTVGQMNQGNETTGPFMGPEPSPARGSLLTREVRSARAEPQRTGYTSRTHEGGPSSASLNHFANVISQAFQTQTDRMVAELRRTNQAPTNVSVSLPPFPSTERVGVFVDVANLLYSARTLRIGVDFGKLLDFLRGNRRLVRAHAYCPTSPQAGDEQMFLQAVKGLGYRITTKNYKTFSSGAKKADLDLDLCMDVVRLVDGRSVDCIVLVSGDSDFMPMLDYCSDHGVRVEVAAFDEAMSATLRQSCDLFVNLSMLEEIRS